MSKGLATDPDDVAALTRAEIASRASDQIAAGLPPGIDVIVPVCNAAGWLDAICDGYDMLGLRPLFIVDSRSADRSLALLQRRTDRVFTAAGAQPFVESLLREIIPLLGSRWVLRMDDDELPSAAALRWIAGNIGAVTVGSVALSRVWVALDRDRRCVVSECEHVGGPWGSDHQIRLFRPADVLVHDRLHTCGFEASMIRAPSEARLYHFDWLARSYEDRCAKIARYERLEEGSGVRYASYYLPEDHDPGIYDLHSADDPAAEAVARKILRGKSMIARVISAVRPVRRP